MARLARERLGAFEDYFRRYGGEPAWGFLVKLGYRTDHAASDDDREHLWFEVHAIEPGRVEATLLNEPYDVARMKEGDRDSHDLELLTDWTVLCQYGRFAPDNISLLAKEIAKGEPPQT